MPKVIDLPTSTSMSDSDYLIMEASGGGTKKITRNNALPVMPVSKGGTGATSRTSAMAALGHTIVQINANTPKTITFSSSYRGLFAFCGTSSGTCGLYCVYCTGTGAVSVIPLITASSVTLTGGSNSTLTINSQTSTNLAILDALNSLTV